MSERQAISKRVRFEVFKRDAFACVYCSAHPPAVILHVDHVHPVAEGGANDIDNLVTACAPCNLGKGARLLLNAPSSLSDRAADIRERESQLAGYEAVLRARRERIENGTDRICTAFAAAFEETNYVTFTDASRASIRRFVDIQGTEQTIDCMLIALRGPAGNDPYSAFRYFCGVCWRRIRERE